MMARQTNLSMVLKLLHQRGQLYRAQLAHLTGLNKSTISSLVQELIDYGLIFETGIKTSGAGRPSTFLDLNPNAGCIIGVEIGVGFLSIIVTNFTGEILWRRFEETDFVTQHEENIAQVIQIVDEARQVAGQSGCRLLGMGITLPGMVDEERGVLVFSPNLQWRDVPLRKIFSEHTGLPVYVDNDANAAALGEHLFGVARQAQDFLFIIDGVGVGGGLFLNGNIYRGARGLAGEIGHTSMYVEQTRPCRCGNRGCWENFANESSLYERIRARLEVGRRSVSTNILQENWFHLNLTVITQAAEAGDVEVLEALSETGKALGMGVANLINIFNPEMIIIGGTLSVVSKFLLPSIKKVVNERALENIRKHTVILDSAFGSDACVMGAVAMVVQAIFLCPTKVTSVHEIQTTNHKEVKRIREDGNR
jgi:glucokinase-like ROK family protein